MEDTERYQAAGSHVHQEQQPLSTNGSPMFSGEPRHILHTTTSKTGNLGRAKDMDAVSATKREALHSASASGRYLGQEVAVRGVHMKNQRFFDCRSGTPVLDSVL
ncbi:hypothetical protein V5799_010461 [Amblyomma americanum]|uniref:Uncharacterized protein n=1 Tax=Amblyomma americanum TaxID=6943 RepID=A0AAQ4EJM1_AMBAM